MAMGDKKTVNKNINVDAILNYVDKTKNAVHSKSIRGCYSDWKEHLYYDWRNICDGQPSTLECTDALYAPTNETYYLKLKDLHSRLNKAFFKVISFEGYSGSYREPIKSKSYKSVEEERLQGYVEKEQWKKNMDTWEEKILSFVFMFLAYTILVTEENLSVYMPELVKVMISELGDPISADDPCFIYKSGDNKSLTNIVALICAASLRVVNTAKRENGFDAPSSENNEDIAWFFNFIDADRHKKGNENGKEELSVTDDYAFVEEQIIRHIWTTNRLIFDNHSLVARRGGIILSDYYVVPALSCLNNKSCEFILDRTDGLPIRARLCAPSGFGKSTLFLAILYCATLDKAVEYGIISSEEERNYRALQKELIGGDKSFPQFLPVVITGSEFSKRKSGDFIDLFAQMIFPTDDHTPEHEIEDKKKWQNILREMIESHADQVLFFCDAFDECDSKYRARYGEKFRMISEHPNGYNILLSYRPLCDEGLIQWKECTQWTILPLSSWGIDKGTNKDKTWLMIRKTTDSICIFDKDESEHYTNLIYDRMNTFPALKEFSVSPYLMSEYVSLCVTSKGEYLEKTVYEMIRDMVSRIFARFNFNDRELNGEKFKEICGGIALNQIQKDPYTMNNLADIFCNVVNKKYPDEDILKYFSTMIACEEINSKSGVLILNNDHSGYVFQANAITMPYLASLEMFSIIYKIVQDAKDFSESNEDTERKIMYELREVLEWIHEDHYIFIPLLIARICDRSSGPNISPRHNQQKKICQLILDCAKSLDIPDKMDTLRDRSFAKTVFCD